jgi:hypothetical protein
MNFELLNVALLVSFGIFVAYLFLEKRKKQLEFDLINSMHIMAGSLKDGDSIETILTDLSRGSDRSSRFFKKALKDIKDGRSISDSLEKLKYDSQVLVYLVRLISAYEHSEENIAEQLDETSSVLTNLQHIEEDLYSQTSAPIIVLQILAVFVAPLVNLFIPFFLDIPIYQPIFYYMGFVVAAYALLEYLAHSDLKRVLFTLPLFVSSYALVISKLATMYLGWLF